MRGSGSRKPTDGEGEVPREVKARRSRSSVRYICRQRGETAVRSKALEWGKSSEVGFAEASTARGANHKREKPLERVDGFTNVIDLEGQKPQGRDRYERRPAGSGWMKALRA
jgi:hypothetical protein